MEGGRLARVRSIVLLLFCSVFLVGCPGGGLFQGGVDPICLEADWIAAAANAVGVQTDTFKTDYAVMVPS